jgi:hypothetical protein
MTYYDELKASQQSLQDLYQSGLAFFDGAPPKNGTFYAWFSEKQAKQNGISLWEGKDGCQSAVTMVSILSAPPNFALPDFDDLIYVGRVDKYVGPVIGPRV